MALLTTMKGLPLAYNRDMQEDKGPLFDAVTTLKGCLGIYIRMLPKLAINAEAMGQAAATGFLNATDLADYLVTRGLPFRKAHGCAGQAVGYAVSVKKELHELSLAELQRFSPLIKADIFEALATRQMVDRRRSLGGTATENVKAALAVARQQLEEDRRRWTPAS
jgi:argininosuccinate lyase